MPSIDSRGLSPRSPFDLSTFVPRSHPTLLRRGLSPTSLALAIIFPIVVVALLSGIVIVIVMRRRRRRRLHQNSPTASMVRNSMEEDLESYRQERQRMGDVVGVGVSAEDLEQQLRVRDSVEEDLESYRQERQRISDISSSLTGSGSRRSSRHTSYASEPRPKSEIEGWYTPPPPPPTAARGSKKAGRGPARAGSRPRSNLRNSIQAEALKPENEVRGYYEPPPKITTI